MWVCSICLDMDRRVASFAKPICHMGCAGMSQKCPLLYPSLAAFDYLAVAVLFPSCDYFWQIIMKMALSQRELLSHSCDSSHRNRARTGHIQHTQLYAVQVKHTHTHIVFTV